MTTHHDPGHGFVIEHDQRDTGRPAPPSARTTATSSACPCAA